MATKTKKTAGRRSINMTATKNPKYIPVKKGSPLHKCSDCGTTGFLSYLQGDKHACNGNGNVAKTINENKPKLNGNGTYTPFNKFLKGLKRRQQDGVTLPSEIRKADGIEAMRGADGQLYVRIKKFVPVPTAVDRIA